MDLDARTNQLAYQCIAFENKLAKENTETMAADSEAESPQKKLRAQVNIFV